jgi:ABC-type Fe3+-citrate transport system substrate-binding protein
LVKVEGGGKEEEMTQTLYAHMNKINKLKNKIMINKKRSCVN